MFTIKKAIIKIDTDEYIENLSKLQISNFPDMFLSIGFHFQELLYPIEFQYP